MTIDADITTSHTGPTIEQIPGTSRALSSRVTTRVDVADVQETRLDGYRGGVKAALPIKGDFLLGVDLSRGKSESVDNVGRTAARLREMQLNVVTRMPSVMSPPRTTIRSSLLDHVSKRSSCSARFSAPWIGRCRWGGFSEFRSALRRMAALNL